MRIALTSVYVESPDKAPKFYTEVLGFIEKLHIPEAELVIVASPEEPDGTGLLLEPNGNPIAKTYQEAVYQAGLPAIVFGVEDIRAEYERLLALGVVFRGEPTEAEWGTQALFEGTCGNLIQLHLVTDGQRPGSAGGALRGRLSRKGAPQSFRARARGRQPQRARRYHQGLLGTLCGSLRVPCGLCPNTIPTATKPPTRRQAICQDPCDVALCS